MFYNKIKKLFIMSIEKTSKNILGYIPIQNKKKTNGNSTQNSSKDKSNWFLDVSAAKGSPKLILLKSIILYAVPKKILKATPIKGKKDNVFRTLYNTKNSPTKLQVSGNPILPSKKKNNKIV